MELIPLCVGEKDWRYLQAFANIIAMASNLYNVDGLQPNPIALASSLTAMASHLTVMASILLIAMASKLFPPLCLTDACSKMFLVYAVQTVSDG